MLIGSEPSGKLYVPPALGVPPELGLLLLDESLLPHAPSSSAATMRTAAKIEQAAPSPHGFPHGDLLDD